MDAAQHQAVVDSLTKKYTETIEKLQNDKAKLEVRSFSSCLQVCKILKCNVLLCQHLHCEIIFLHKDQVSDTRKRS